MKNDKLSEYFARGRNALSVIWEKLKQGIFQMFSANVLNNAINLISNMALTRLLTKEEYGIWSYVTNIYMYLHLVNGFGLSGGALQFAIENRDSRKKYEYFKYCVIFGFLLDFVIVIAVIGIAGFTEFAFERAREYLQSFIGIIILQYAFMMLTSILRCDERIPEYAGALNRNTVLTAFFTCAGAGIGIEGIIVGKYLAVILSLIELSFRLKDQIKKVAAASLLPLNLTKELWRFSIIMCICSALNTVMYLIDTTMIGALIKDAGEIATYKVATMIPNALGFIPSSVLVYVVPKVITHRDDARWMKSNIRKIFGGMGAFNFFIVAALVLFAPLILSVISGRAYISSAPAFRVLCVGYFVSGTFSSLSVQLIAALRKVRFSLFISVITCVLDVVFNYAFITKFGSIGAAYATLSTIVVVAAVSFGYFVNFVRSMGIRATVETRAR